MSPGSGWNLTYSGLRKSRWISAIGPFAGSATVYLSAKAWLRKSATRPIATTSFMKQLAVPTSVS